MAAAADLGEAVATVEGGEAEGDSAEGVMVIEAVGRCVVVEEEEGETAAEAAAVDVAAAE